MTASPAQRRAGWRYLGLFWAGIFVIVGVGGVLLQILGPPPPRVEPVADLHAATAPSVVAAPPTVPSGQIAAPQSALLEPSKAFPPAMLPRIASDGRVARVVYARVAEATGKRPRIAVVVTGLGMSDTESRAAIQALPGPISLAFSPYASSPDALLDLCRKTGHEMLISLPLEPQGYPLNDAGSRSLLTGATPAQNSTNLEWSLSRIQGYVGAIGALDAMRGERFGEQSSSLGVVLDELSRRGLLYVDPRPGKNSERLASVPGRAVDVVIDEPPARAEIEGKLAALERVAREKGSAVGLAGPLRPVTVERLAAWSHALGDRGIALVPVSALTNDMVSSEKASGGTTP